MKHFFFPIIFLFFACFHTIYAQYSWADSIFSKLSLEEKIAQLMIIRVPSNENDKIYPAALEQIKNGAGGICFFAGKSDDQLRLTKHFQKEAKAPLFVSIDGEWGLGMRLTDGYSFPRQIMLGAIPDEDLIYQMAEEIALQCKKMGIHINYAPDCDINTNPVNPVIGNRSFGENKHNVTKKSIAYMKGLQNNGIMAVAKHFPGHGDTETDSHYDLPIINHSKIHMDSVELYPFKKLIADNIDGIMVSHLYVSAYDTTPNLPAVLSYEIVSELLRKQMNFSGLIFTDGLEMKGVTKYFKNGEAELHAILAGNDILLLPADVPKAIKTIADAASNNSILRDIIDIKCRRILIQKHLYGLSKTFAPDKLSKLSESDIQRADRLTEAIARQSITLLENKKNVLPIQDISSVKIGFLNLDAKSDNLLKMYLLKYAPADCYVLSKLSTQQEIEAVLKQIPLYDYWIMAGYGTHSNSPARNYGFSAEILRIAGAVIQNRGRTKLIAGIFGSPYILSSFPETENIDALIMGYQDIPQTQKAFAEAVFGGLETKGRLPVSASADFKEGTGILTQKIRLGYKSPEQMHLSPVFFKKIDSIANKGIIDEAYPGCQVLIAKDGYIIHDKSYGRTTYSADSPWTTDMTLYDIASLTKVTATTIALMKLVDEGKIKLNDPLSKYLPYLKADKQNITIKETLSHVAGLKSFTPFWKSLLKDSAAMKTLFAVSPADSNAYYQLTDSFFVKKDYRSALLDSIANTPLNKQKGYVYSDFGFILLGDLVERVTRKPLDVYMDENFYHPLGMNRTFFNPMQKGISKDFIASTENDVLFRKAVIQGFAHDPTAALMGGRAGHAGLFSTAEDLAKLYQMLLNEGNYGGKHYLTKDVIMTFNYPHYAKQNVRRSLGFDKPLLNSESTHISPYASPSSFGHTGFTGTMVWIDPEYNLIYIFLSNRIYPDAEPNKLASMNIRTNIQTEIYKAIIDSKQYKK